MHEELRKIYPETVNTIRIMAINRDGKTPKIMNAYMRIGSSKTGLTDNVAYGGVFCPVNIEDGHYHDGEQLHNHVITPCPNHPDTGALIDGYVPLWPEVKKMIEDICLIMPELEYLGFDVAITDKGVKVLEVNRHQDLHRAYAYGDEVQAFFKEKIELKKKRMGIKD